MQLNLHLIRGTLICAALHLAPMTLAEEGRPVFSEPYVVANAGAAYTEIDVRWDAAQAEQQARFSAFEGDASEFVRNDPILQQVSWPYEDCTDLISLIPPPMEGWGVRSDASFVKNPVGPERAQVGYVRYAPGMSSAEEGFFGTEESVSASFSTSPDMVQFFGMMIGQEAMRDVAFDEGPYGYPLFKHTNRTLLGHVTVEVSATQPEDAQLYLQEIIGCAIRTGLIAEGVDPESLRPDP